MKQWVTEPMTLSIFRWPVRRWSEAQKFVLILNSQEQPMKFMIIVKATPDSEAGRFPPDSEKMFAEMADYHEQLAKAGVLLDGSGLQPSSKGWRIRYDGARRTVVDGPFAESKELIAGYTVIQVRNRDEALEWSRRFPNPVGGNQPAEIEVRQLYGLEDFDGLVEPGTADRFKKIGME
ncbi:MAG: dehydrogenase [Ramlibacter sp.]|jgi:hypothetical protein|nr:dehydrogenase [Ramlibacter sp.]